MKYYSTIQNMSSMDLNYTKVKNKDIQTILNYYGFDNFDLMIKEMKRDLKIKNILNL